MLRSRGTDCGWGKWKGSLDGEVTATRWGEIWLNAGLSWGIEHNHFGDKSFLQAPIPFGQTRTTVQRPPDGATIMASGLRIVASSPQDMEMESLVLYAVCQPPVSEGYGKDTPEKGLIQPRPHPRSCTSSRLSSIQLIQSSTS